MTPAPISRATTSHQALRPAPGRSVRLAAAAAALVGLAVHLWGLYRDHGPPSVPWFPQADKLEHLVGFGLPCFLVLLALHLHVSGRGRLSSGRTSSGRTSSGCTSSGRTSSRRAVALVVGLFVLHAGVSEVVQGELYTTRSGDPADALADVVGTALGLAAYLLLRRRAAHARA